jgi:hypothetical protein
MKNTHKAVSLSVFVSVCVIGVLLTACGGPRARRDTSPTTLPPATPAAVAPSTTAAQPAPTATASVQGNTVVQPSTAAHEMGDQLDSLLEQLDAVNQSADALEDVPELK